jgi:hypothetical protein
VYWSTVARWPIFRPNNSKQAGKKYFWPGKIGGHRATNFSEKWLKRGRKKLFHFVQRCFAKHTPQLQLADENS